MKNINRFSFFVIALALVFGVTFGGLTQMASAQTTNTSSDASVNVKVNSSVRPAFWQNLKDRWFKNNATNIAPTPDNVSIPTTGDALSYPKTQTVKYDAGMTNGPTVNTTGPDAGTKETRTGIFGRWNLDSVELSTPNNKVEKIATGGVALNLSNSGKFELVGNCNYIFGEWQRPADDAGDLIKFFNVTATEKPCVICQSTECTETKTRTNRYLGLFKSAQTILVDNWKSSTKLTLIALDESKQKVYFSFSRGANTVPIDGGIKPIRPNPTVKPPVTDFSDNAIESRFNQTFRQLTETHKKISGLVDRVEMQAKKMEANGTDITAETQYILQAQANLKRAATAIADAQTSFKLELQTYKDTGSEKSESNSSLSQSINSSENSKKYFAKTLANINQAKASLKTAKDNVDQTWSLLKAKLIEEQEARGGNDDTSDNTDQSTDSSL